jgi:hypothetical protein
MLTLWEVLPTDKEVKPVVRWNVRAADSGPGTEPWARLIDGNLVVHRYAENEYVVWDAAQKQMVWRTKQESFFRPAPVLSGGGKYLFLPEDSGVRLLESASGRFVGTLTAKDGASGVAVSEDGRRAAVLGRSTITVWDLADLKAPPQHYQAEAVGTPFSASLAWVGDDRILVERQHSQVLYSLKHKITLWRYDFDQEANPSLAVRGRRLCEVIDSHLLYTAVLRGPQTILAVGAVKLPGPRVDEVTAAVDPQSLLVLQRGSQVRLVVEAGEFTQRVTDAMESHLQANGWTISPNASIVVTAVMRRGETQTTTYQERFSGQVQSVTITPFISEVKITVNNQVAWHAATTSGARRCQSWRGGTNRSSPLSIAGRCQTPAFSMRSTFRRTSSIRPNGTAWG